MEGKAYFSHLNRILGELTLSWLEFERGFAGVLAHRATKQRHDGDVTAT
jgi:hypothetical protein